MPLALPNPSLQRTRLRRAGTGRSWSQAFGLAAVRVYHRRAAELNRSAAQDLAALLQARRAYASQAT
jgi:hypothetical protein